MIEIVVPTKLVIPKGTDLVAYIQLGRAEYKELDEIRMLEASALGLKYIWGSLLPPLVKVTGKVLQCEITNNFVQEEYTEGHKFETWWTFLTIEDEHVLLLKEEFELPFRKLCEIEPITSFLTEEEKIEKSRQEEKIWKKKFGL